MSDVDQFEEKIFSSLRAAVRDALERKKKLGQYAVVWRDGEVVKISGDELTDGLDDDE